MKRTPGGAQRRAPRRGARRTSGRIRRRFARPASSSASAATGGSSCRRRSNPLRFWLEVVSGESAEKCSGPCAPSSGYSRASAAVTRAATPRRPAPGRGRGGRPSARAARTTRRRSIRGRQPRITASTADRQERRRRLQQRARAPATSAAATRWRRFASSTVSSTTGGRTRAGSRRGTAGCRRGRQQRRRDPRRRLPVRVVPDDQEDQAARQRDQRDAEPLPEHDGPANGPPSRTPPRTRPGRRRPRSTAVSRRRQVRIAPPPLQYWCTSACPKPSGSTAAGSSTTHANSAHAAIAATCSAAARASPDTRPSWAPHGPCPLLVGVRLRPTGRRVLARCAQRLSCRGRRLQGLQVGDMRGVEHLHGTRGGERSNERGSVALLLPVDLLRDVDLRDGFSARAPRRWSHQEGFDQWHVQLGRRPCSPRERAGGSLRGSSDCPANLALFRIRPPHRSWSHLDVGQPRGSASRPAPRLVSGRVGVRLEAEVCARSGSTLDSGGRRTSDRRETRMPTGVCSEPTRFRSRADGAASSAAGP